MNLIGWNSKNFVDSCYMYILSEKQLSNFIIFVLKANGVPGNV